MQSLWNDDEAAQYEGELGRRTYTSRLLGRDKTLVLQGGGNTSLKVVEKNLFGEDQNVLYVKGSGCDLETIDAAGFAPLSLEHLRRLTQLETLSDTHLADELVTHTLKSSAPAPSIETLLHAYLPHKYVDHTHADAVLAVTNAPEGERHIREIYGDTVVIVPYVMPGLGLAKLCAREYSRQSNANTIGMVLMNHGIFSFGDSARQSYERMIELVGRAEDYLKAQRAWDIAAPYVSPAPIEMLQQAQLRRKLSDAAGAPMIMATLADDETLAFAQRADLRQLSQQGPITPDHIIRTKRLPMLGTDVDAYVRDYRAYCDEQAPHATGATPRLDPAPRVALDPGFGLVVAGRTANDAAIVADVYRHSMQAMQRSQALGGYRALSVRELFRIEYWDLEQRKLRKEGLPPPYAGEIALVTGAASGIGKACVEALLARGAAVVGLDIHSAVEQLFRREDFLGIRCDLNDERAVTLALERPVFAYGGLDMLVLNAGIFPASRTIDELATDEWRKVMAINLDANLFLLRACHPLLKLAPKRGRVVVIGSKNVPAPGRGGLFRLQGRTQPTRTRRRAGVGGGRDTHQLSAPERGVRHRHLDRRGAVQAGQALWSHRGRIQNQQCAQDRGQEPRRRRTRRRDVRAAVRQDHSGAGAGGRRQRTGHLNPCKSIVRSD
jgi:rhamnose utilization protein RhaD (predicted bifunctional aldolase and dehydrogenase)/NAD(P)-dependent dehydrogenase (short-subunit alcohol dehydrogenase family)